MSRYLILGASSEVALAFMKAHAWSEDDEVIAQYFSHKDALEELAGSIPAKVIMRRADFMMDEGVSEFVEFLREEKFTPTHILHAPAFPVRNARLTELEWGDFRAQMMIQVRSFFEVMRTVIKPMSRAGGGRVVVVLSAYTMNVPPSFLSDYVTAKYALMGFTKSIAAEYAGKKILVNMISPSMMETKFLAGIYEGVSEHSAAHNPMKRNARPEDSASLVEYLLSDSNTFITGANIPVTGGEEY
ncbi:MAG: SDR family oxidoreductase [Synergistaceae bacterium]|nr:SDR family oxidoreductase [Synergistaceae bacterium]